MAFINTALMQDRLFSHPGSIGLPPIVDYLNDGGDGDRVIVEPMGAWINKLNAFAADIDSRKNLRYPNVCFNIADADSQIAIETFVAAPRPSSKATVDCYLSAGGPVLSVAFNILPTDLLSLSKAHERSKNVRTQSRAARKQERYLAVCLSRIGWQTKEESRSLVHHNTEDIIEQDQEHFEVGEDSPQSLKKISTNPSLVEMWSIDDDGIKLAYCFGFASRGSIWEAAWSSVQIEDPNVIGILALCCGDGRVLILAVPTIEYLLASCKQKIKTPVINGERFVYWELSCKHHRVMSIAWNQLRPWELACGISDGSIAIWQLNASHLNVASPRIHRPDQSITLVDLSPDRIAVSSSIRSVDYCPFDSNLILSCGYDCEIKIWNTSSHRTRPIMRKAITEIGWVFDAEWDPLGLGIYYTGSDRSRVLWNGLWNNLSNSRNMLYEHEATYSCVWKIITIPPERVVINSHHHNRTTLVSTSADGTVRCTYSSEIVRRKSKSVDNVLQLFKICAISERGATAGSGDHIVEEGDIYWADNDDTRRGPRQRVQVDVEIDKMRSRIGKMTTTASPAMSIQALHHCNLGQGGRIVAYGGALGLVRVHSVA
jgi:WD40 repeat protein